LEFQQVTGPKGEGDSTIGANKKAAPAIHNLRPNYQPRKLQDNTLTGIPRNTQ